MSKLNNLEKFLSKLQTSKKEAVILGVIVIIFTIITFATTVEHGIIYSASLSVGVATFLLACFFILKLIITKLSAKTKKSTTKKEDSKFLIQTVAVIFAVFIASTIVMSIFEPSELKAEREKERIAREKEDKAKAEKEANEKNKKEKEDKAKAEKEANEKNKKEKEDKAKAEKNKKKETLEQSDAEKACQDEIIIKNILPKQVTLIDVWNYKNDYHDGAGYDEKGYPVMLLRWNGKNKDSKENVGFTCWISGPKSSYTIHNIALDGSDIYGSLNFKSYNKNGELIE